jgi:hypothetical protein
MTLIREFLDTCQKAADEAPILLTLADQVYLVADHIREQERDLAAAKRLATKPATGRQALSREAANAIAQNVAKELGEGFFSMSMRKQASLIGCHHRTWQQTELYKSAVKRGRITPPKPRAPRTVSLTKELEAVTGEGEKDETQKKASEQELQRLLRAHTADHEPSPLSDDPPGRQRRIHSRKRL